VKPLNVTRPIALFIDRTTIFVLKVLLSGTFNTNIGCGFGSKRCNSYVTSVSDTSIFNDLKIMKRQNKLSNNPCSFLLIDNVDYG